MSDQPGHESAADISIQADIKALIHRMAGVQPAEGTYVSAATWVWVQAFCDFDYEYAYLLDVRRADPKDVEATAASRYPDNQYLAIFEGYDKHGLAVYRSTWYGHPVVSPEVPNLYDALAWWAAWVKETRTGEHEG